MYFSKILQRWCSNIYNVLSQYSIDSAIGLSLPCILTVTLGKWLKLLGLSFLIYSVQSLSHALLFVTPWTATHQVSLSITNTRSLLKLMSIESVIPSNRLILCHLLLILPSIFPSIRVFSSESALHSRWPKYLSFNLASVFPMNIQDWYPLRLTGLISLQPKRLSRIFSCTTQKHQFFGTSFGIWVIMTS